MSMSRASFRISIVSSGSKPLRVDLVSIANRCAGRSERVRAGFWLSDQVSMLSGSEIRDLRA